MIPDGEAVLTAYLKVHPDVKALGARVVGEAPSDKTKPWVKIVQIDDSAVGGSRTEHLIAWMGDFHCYAGETGGQGEASLLRKTVRAALNEASKASHEGAVITGVEFLSCPRVPDPDFEPARQRYIQSATVWMHP